MERSNWNGNSILCSFFFERLTLLLTFSMQTSRFCTTGRHLIAVWIWSFISFLFLHLPSKLETNNFLLEFKVDVPKNTYEIQASNWMFYIKLTTMNRFRLCHSHDAAKTLDNSYAENFRQLQFNFDFISSHVQNIFEENGLFWISFEFELIFKCVIQSKIDRWQTKWQELIVQWKVVSFWFDSLMCMWFVYVCEFIGVCSGSY